MTATYLKLAFKILLRRKFYTFISLFAICFTLVVLTVATALIDATLGPMAPESKSDRMLGIYRAEIRGAQSRRTGFPGYAMLDRYARDLPGVETASICTVVMPVFTYPNGERMKMYLKRTDAEYWRILDFAFLEGGPYTREDVDGGNRVAVINEATRRRLFGAEPCVGRSFTTDGQTYRVVGVVADVPFLRLVSFSDVWAPLTTAKSEAYRTELVGSAMGILLARDSADFPAIRAEFESRLRGADLSSERGYDTLVARPETLFEWGAATFTNAEAGSGSTTAFLGLLGLVMALFMLLPTINLTNVNVSRILERASEIGVRKAFGASSATLVGQFLVENLAVTVTGALAAFALSQVALSAISASGLIPYADLRINLRVFLYGLCIATFFGIVSGVYPAWKMSRLDPVAALKGVDR